MNHRSRTILVAIAVISVQLTTGAVAEAQESKEGEGEREGADGLKVGGMSMDAQGHLSIAGKVMDPKGKPLAGVEIEVTMEGISKTFDAISKKKGKFNLLVPNKDAHYRASARLEGYKQVKVEVGTNPGGKVLLNITMEQVQEPVEGATTSVDAVMVTSEVRQPEKKTSTGQSAAAEYEQALAALQAGDPDTAAEKLQQVVELAPDVAEPHAFLAQALLERGEHAAAAAEAERALELEPTQARALFVRYQAYRALGDEERAEGALAALKASSGAGGSAMRIFNEGAEAYSAGDMATAKARFVVATEIDPTLPEAFTALAEIYRLEGDFEQSLAMADSVLELRPGDPTGRLLRFKALLSLQRTEELRATLDELATADPEWAASQLPRIALATFNRDLIPSAVVLYEKTVEVDPDNAKAYYTLGLCYFNSGDTAHAGEAMRRFLELAPDDPNAAAARSMLEYVE